MFCGLRGRLQAAKLGCYLLLVIFSVGGDGIGEVGHRGGGVDNLFTQLF